MKLYESRERPASSGRSPWRRESARAATDFGQARMGLCAGPKNGRQRMIPRMPQHFFQVTNTIALLAWIGLVLFPGRRAVSHLLCATVIPGLLAACYAAVIGWKLASNGPPPGDVMTIDGLRAVFSDDWVFAAAWTHYLVFDMVVGAWIARDAVRLGIPWPLRTIALVLTFLAGPVGFLLHLVTRFVLRRAVATDTAAA